MSKTVVALGGSVEAIPVLRRVRELGYRLIVVDGNPDAPGRALADNFLVESCYSPASTLFELNLAHETFDGVLCAAIDAPLVAAEVARAFGLPGLSVEAAMLGADKYKQSSALRDSGIPVPDFEIFDIGDEYASFIGPDHAWNIASRGWSIVKPLDSRGARGVFRVYSGYWAVSWDRFVLSKSQSPSGRVMVEEWLDGPQLSTESLVQDGKVLFTAVGLRNYARLEEFAPYVVEDGFDSPYQAPIETYLEIENLIEDSCKALGWTNCVCKGDLVIHNGRVHVIELAPRLSGGLFCAAHELAYGVDFIGDAVRLSLGETIEPPTPRPGLFVSQRYIFPETKDIGKRIVSMSMRLVPHRVFEHFSKLVGHVIQPVTAHPDRLGQAMCIGATPQEARERAERAVKEMYNGMVVE